MKTIKVITDYGIKDCRTIGRANEIKGELWQLCEVPVKYMNCAEPLMIRKVIHLKTGGNLPIRGHSHKATVKDFMTDAAHFLNEIPDDAIKKELSSREVIN